MAGESVVISVKATGGQAVKNELVELKTIVDQLNKTQVNIQINSNNLNTINQMLKQVDNYGKIAERAGKQANKIFESTTESEDFLKKVEKTRVAVGKLEQTVTKYVKTQDGLWVKKPTETTESTNFEQIEKALQKSYDARIKELAKQRAYEEKELAKSQAQWQEYYNNLNNVQETAGKSAEQSAKTFQKSFSKIGEYTSTLENGASAQGAKSFIATLDGIDASSIKVKGSVDVLGKSFTTFEAYAANADGSLSKMTFSMDNATGAIYQTATATEKLSLSQKLLGDSFGDIVAKMAVWQLFGDAIAKPIAAFKEATATMKSVDAELTNIQKVTGASSAEMSALGKQAYSVASSYGVAADEMLEAASTFSKAGYENYAALAELSTKTQLVGDVTADMASKFLLSADAAYQYSGDVSQLSTVLDKANAVENKFATSIEKIAEGFPNVASTAAMANMSIDELIASLGTITAVTQESGSKASYALRALILNILGEVGEVVDDDLTVTQESVDSITDALKKYGSESIKAAQATGQLIDPMEAIRSLSQAYSDGLLSDIELEKILVNVGGKLRTNQLTALVKNFDMVEAQLATMRQAAGSADEEMNVMLSSWEAKANILKNTFTEFISTSLSSDIFKGAIDEVTWLIDGVGDLGNALLIVSGSIVAIKSENVLTFVEKAVTKVRNLKSDVSGLVSIIKEKGLSETLKGLASPGAVIGTATAVFSIATIAINKIKQAREEAKQLAVENATSNLEEVSSLKSLREEYLAIADSTASEADKNAQLAEWKQKLISEYGFEAEALNKVNLARETGLALLDQESSKHANSAWLSIQKEYNRVAKRMGEQKGGNVWLPSATGMSEFALNKSDAKGDIEKINKALEETGFQLDVVKKVLSSKEFDSLEERNEALAKAANIMDEMAKKDSTNVVAKKLSNYFKGLYNENAKYIEQNKEVYSAGKQAFAEYILSLDENMLAMSKIASQSDYDAFVEKLKSQGYAADVTKAALAELASMFPQFAASSDNATSSADSFSNANEQVEGSVRSVSAALSEAKTAIDEYNKALEGGEKGDTFEDYETIFNKTKALYSKGLFGSNEYRAGLKALLPEDVLAAYDGDWEKAGEILGSQFWQGVFNEKSDDYGLNFVQSLYNNGDKYLSGLQKVVDGTTTSYYTASGELVLALEKVGDSLNYDVSNAEALAEALGVSPEVIYSILDALSIYNKELSVSSAEALDYAKNVEGAFSEIEDGVKKVDASKLAEGLKEAGKSTEEIDAIISKLKEMDDVEFVSFDEENLAGATEQIESFWEKWTGRSNEPVTLSVDAETSQADKGLSGVFKKLKGIAGTNAKPKVTTNTTQAETAIDKIKKILQWLDGKTFSSKVTIATSGLSSAEKAQQLLANTGKHANASGTSSFVGGETLINELGPELIRIGNKAYVAESGLPTVVSLPRGAQIFDAVETKRILSGGELEEMYPANATAAAGTVKLSKTKTNTTTKSTTKSNTQATNKAKKQSTTTESDTKLDALKDRVSLLKSELELLVAQNAPLSQRIAKIQEIQTALHNQASYMRAIGEEQAEINALSVSWLDYQKQIREETQAIMQAERELLENRVSLLEKQGASSDEIVALLKKEQQSLHDEAEYLRSIEAEEKDIIPLSVEWWEIQERIVEAYKQAYETEQAILESESTLLENQKASYFAQIEKLRERQELLHKEAEYLRSINASQEEINALSNEWWSIENKIQDILSSLSDELETALDVELKKAEEVRDEKLKALDEELDALEKTREIEEDKLELKEKQQAVTDAEIALINAQNERTVRMYNGATGQWEWIAKASDVQNAQKNLDDAKKSLQDYLDDKEYERKKSDIEARRQEVEDEYDALADEIAAFKESLKEPARGIVEVLKDIQINGTGRLKNAVNGISGILESLSEANGETYQLGTPETSTSEEKTSVSFAEKDYANDSTDYSQKMLNSESWEEFAHWRSEREKKIQAQGIDIESSGYRTNDELLQEWKKNHTYDSGGILRGIGGIKATKEDETILPPDITSAMLSPIKSGMLENRMEELRYLYGVSKKGNAESKIGIGTQHNGNVYQLGGVTLSEQQAKGMTVFELAQIARTLSVQKTPI